MKAFVRGILNRFGYSLRHSDADPVITKLDHVRENLRLCSRQPELRLHELSQLALFAHLRALIDVQRPDLVIDVGANRGQFAGQLREFGYTGPIISIEPQRALAAALQERATVSDPAWTVLHGAAGDAPGELVLNVFADDTFSSFHTPSRAARDRFGELVAPNSREIVPVFTLTSWLAGSIHRDAARIFIKSDTQGHDLAVLRGSPLDRTCMVLAEASAVPLYDSAYTPEELACLLAPAGLRPAGFYAVSHDKTDLAVLELDCLFTRLPS